MENGKDLKEYMLKEIDILQGTIKRMASNSFLLKGWSVTLVVGIMLLRGGGEYQVLLGFIPLVVFWYLDAYFLRQERLFRRLYEWVIHYRLGTDEFLFDMKTSRFEKDVDSIWRTMFGNENDKDGTRKTNTLRWFYGSMAIMLLAYSAFLFIVQRGGC